MQSETLKCADARHLIHLAVGDDTLADEEKQLSEHLHSCSDCRAYHAGMVDAMQVLESVRDDDSVDIPAGAVWSAISHRVKSRPSMAPAIPERRRFNGAVAALCACSLTLALVTVIQNLPTADHGAAATYGVPAAMNVSYQGSQNAPLQTQQLEQRRLPSGEVVWFNPKTQQYFVPNLLSSGPDEENTSF